METLRQFKGIELRAEGNHMIVLKNDEIVFDEAGTWAPRDATGIFRKLCDEIRAVM